MATTIVGLFDTSQAAEAAIHELTRQGIPRDEISLLARDENRPAEARPSAAGTNDVNLEGDTPALRESMHQVEGGEDVGTNAAAGALFGGVGGALLAIGAFVIPGLGPILVAGPLASLLAGAGVGGLGGAVIGWLKEHGIGEEHAHVYAESVRQGGSLVSVQTDGAHEQLVRDIFHTQGAANVEERGTSLRDSGWNQFDDSRPHATPVMTGRPDTTDALPPVTGPDVMPDTVRKSDR